MILLRLPVRVRVYACVILALLLPGGRAVRGSEGEGGGIVDKQRVVAALLRNEHELRMGIGSYTRLQHYTATTERFKAHAEMLVKMYYDHQKGKHFEVLSRSGTPYIQSKIFDKLLKAEVDSSMEYIKEGSLVSPHYYSFELLGQEKLGERNCYLLEIKPLRKDKRLVAGKAWVDAHDYELVRTEGRLSASLSFWAGKPTIVEEFQKAGKYRVALRRHSTTDTFILGKSELTIEYNDYHITNSDGTPVTGLDREK